ncbi:hypothetical protein B0H14DRAFT_3500030 [Mycena olivaceomarginata]|nr:hypothetical protein B0H14DRAFT_3500030 [Mycena olivaceomarginata]
MAEFPEKMLPSWSIRQTDHFTKGAIVYRDRVSSRCPALCVNANDAFAAQAAGLEERARIVDAICPCDGEMMMGASPSFPRLPLRYANHPPRYAKGQQLGCLEATTGPEERRKIVACMRGRIVDLAPNCCGYRVHQKALDCKEEEVCLVTGSELPRIDPATTLVNKHVSHVSNKHIAPPLLIDADSNPSLLSVNKFLKGKYAALACHETGLLVVQRAKDGIVDELLGQAPRVRSSVSAKIPILIIFIDTVLEHRSEKHRKVTLEHSLTACSRGREGDARLRRAAHVRAGEWVAFRRAMIVDLALSLTGSQLIASVLPMADKDQRASLYDCIRGHVARLPDRLDGYLACVRPSNLIPPLPAPVRALLHDRMRAYYRY